MSHKVDRLQLIRERHRKIILEPRETVVFDAFDDDFADEFDFIDEEVFTRQLRESSDED